MSLIRRTVYEFDTEGCEKSCLIVLLALIFAMMLVVLFVYGVISFIEAF